MVTHVLHWFPRKRQDCCCFSSPVPEPEPVKSNDRRIPKKPDHPHFPTPFFSWPLHTTGSIPYCIAASDSSASLRPSLLSSFQLSQTRLGSGSPLFSAAASHTSTTSQHCVFEAMFATLSEPHLQATSCRSGREDGLLYCGWCSPIEVIMCELANIQIV